MSDRDVSAADALDLVGLAGLDPEAVLFWTGAGITRDDPTCAPFGAELTERALGQFFEPLCLSRVRDYYRAMRIARDFPRLETVLDVINRVFGLDALADALSDLRHPPPNDLHAFFAQHLDAGGHQITANFDDCIERSVASTAPRTDRLIHFHGSFAADPTGADLGATFTNIQSGFAADVAEHLRATLTRRDAKAIVFAGYSGHDAFDVNPFLQTLAPLRELGGKTVVLDSVPTSGDDAFKIRGNSPDERVRRAFNLLRDAGATASNWRANYGRFSAPSPPSGASLRICFLVRRHVRASGRRISA